MSYYSWNTGIYTTLNITIFVFPYVDSCLCFKSQNVSRDQKSDSQVTKTQIENHKVLLCQKLVQTCL